MNPSSLRRLASDHAALHKSDLPPYYLWPAASTGGSDDLTQLNILLAGPPGTPYEDGIWRLQLKIPSDYPKSPPRAFFRSKIWHPNVDESSGSVCLNTLKRDWESKLTLRDILITISCLLINPNPDSALNTPAGQLLQENWDEFARHARLMSSIHAKVPAGQKDAVIEARRRGEEAEPEPESDDEEENSKENDIALDPPVRECRPLASVRPSTVLGKRPLADLPVPLEPLSDDEDETMSSARNIAANTPNLSNHLASVSFDSSSSPWTSATPKALQISTRKLVERIHSTNASSQGMAAVTRVETGRASCHDSGAPSAKRLCASTDKENVIDATMAVASAHVLPTVPGVIGLGVKTQPAVPATSLTSRKVIATATGAVRPKARVGLRRL